MKRIHYMCGAFGYLSPSPQPPAYNSFPHLITGYTLSANCMLGTGLRNSDTKINKITFPVFKEQENNNTER